MKRWSVGKPHWTHRQTKIGTFSEKHTLTVSRRWLIQWLICPIQSLHDCKEWKELLRKYTLPPCQTCQYNNVALSFGIGNVGSGVQWHIHGPGFSEALVGRKHWILYPPSASSSTKGNTWKPVGFNKDQSSRQWMEYYYPHESKASATPLLHECTRTCS